MNENVVVVLGRNYASRLGMIRAAGMAGYVVDVIKTDKSKKSWNKPNPIDSVCKYVRNYTCFFEPDDIGIIKHLISNYKNESSTPILLPTDDYTAALIDKNVKILADYFLFPNIKMQAGKVISFMDKAVQKRIAKDVGLKTVDGWVVKWSDGKYLIPMEIRYPCFVKPEVSFLGNKSALVKCDNKEQLIYTLENNKNHIDVLVEEFIEIEKEYDIPGLSLDTVFVFPGIIEKGLIYRGVTGSGTMHNIEKFDSLYIKLKSLLKKIGFTGLIDIELFEANGIIYFNELNLRFGASGFAMTGSGLNLPGVFLEYLRSGSIDIYDANLSFGKRFVSEKVCFEKYYARKSTWREYRKLVGDADFLFIHSEEDVKPGRKFDTYVNVRRILRMLRSKD